MHYDERWASPNRTDERSPTNPRKPLKRVELPAKCIVKALGVLVKKKLGAIRARKDMLTRMRGRLQAQQ